MDKSSDMSVSELIGVWSLRHLARRGQLTLDLPSGTRRIIGHGPPRADLTLRNMSAVGQIIRHGLLGFATAHIDGRIETSDLRNLALWGVENQRLWLDHPVTRATQPIRRLAQRVRRDRRHVRVQTMGDHYNLGNDFYHAWLDESMTYSSARFASSDQSLRDAQMNKYRTIADHAWLEPGKRVLEIGCGWGGFAEYAATERGCEVVAITLSEKQASFAEKRIADAGLADRVEVRIQDFREVRGTFDAIVSIEMIESVDETHWGPLFRTMSDRLTADGRAALQVITIKDSEWETYRTRTDFIREYIFPGGQLPAPKVLRSLAASEDMVVEQVETFGLDYARTLAAWRNRFTEAWQELSTGSNLDERFRRMWDLYLTLCEAGFRSRWINVEQWVFART